MCRRQCCIAPTSTPQQSCEKRFLNKILVCETEGGMKTFVTRVLVLALLSGPSMAMAQNPCISGSLFGVVGYYQPKTGQSCETWGGGVGVLICWAYNALCAPAAAPNETSCPDCGGRPIRLANGQTFIEQTDVRIPGLGNGLNLVRTWNSLWPVSQSSLHNGIFGSNWRSTYEERVFLASDGYVRYARGDGSFWSFGYGSALVTVAPANAAAILVQNATYWTLTLKDGEQRRFDINSGSLTAIIDRNGNTTTLSYDGLNRLTTVTDPVSRHLTFTYASPTSFLVTGVSSDVGLSLTYTYDAQNRLLQVTKPDLTTLNFQYDANSMITAVLDSDGKVLESHTYDGALRGLTSSRANGVELLHFAYH
jgi:YD repeat-containing protein